MEKINIVELLKECPKGMELDCVLFDGVVFDEIDDDEYCGCLIVIKTREGETWNLTSTGCWDDSPSAKCVIFPKGKTTWEGFVPPCKFKDGDVVFSGLNLISIFKGIKNGVSRSLHSYVSACVLTDSLLDSTIIEINRDCWTLENIRLATEEEKEKLFQVIKDNGYKWNVETKTLEKLIEPIFKIGNRIKYKNGVEQGVIESITDDTYDIAVTNNMGIYVSIADQDEWELVSDKFDISSLKPFQKLLVRDSENQTWKTSMWECYQAGELYPYFTMAGCFKMCIPYESNVHLLGTTDDCKDFYKTWE